MDIQRLRNLTTGRLHTDFSHVYTDLEAIIGETGIMTHMLPRVLAAVKPWLREHVADPRFWDDKSDLTHTGEFNLSEPTAADRAAMLERFKAMPNPLEDKNVIMVSI